MKKSDYVTKLDTMIDDRIIKGTYVETTDNTLKELLRFQDFLYRNFHNYECYKDFRGAVIAHRGHKNSSLRSHL